jgi:hypothetical protein
VTAVLEPIVKSQPISGVSAGTEAEIMTVYPSLAATNTGQLVGRLCDGIQLKTHDVSWGRLLIAIPFWLLVVPFAATVALALYAVTKVLGKRYVLTNRSVYVRQMIGVRTFAQAALADVAEIIIQELPGQSFYKAADIVLKGTDGKTRLRLDGVLRPAVFRQTILEARDARQSVEESLKTIQARKPPAR